MLVVTRHVVAPASAADFLAEARAAVAVLAGRPGFRSGSIARAVDDPTLFSIVTRWVDVGSYRRALSDYEVKLTAVPLLSTALDEPSAFEVLHSRDPAGTTDTPGVRAADAAEVGLGRAAGPDVPRLPS